MSFLWNATQGGTVNPKPPTGRAIIIVHAYRFIEYGVPGDTMEACPIDTERELVGQLVEVCEKLHTTGVTHVLLVGNDTAEEVRILANYFDGQMEFEQYELFAALVHLARSLPTKLEMGELDLHAEAIGIVCASIDGEQLLTDAYRIREGYPLTTAYADAGCSSSGVDGEEYVYDALRQLRQMGVCDIAVFVPDDRDTWRVVMQIAFHQLQADIGMLRGEFRRSRWAALSSSVTTLTERQGRASSSMSFALSPPKKPWKTINIFVDILLVSDAKNLIGRLLCAH